jgi:hypothetical protein
MMVRLRVDEVKWLEWVAKQRSSTIPEVLHEVIAVGRQRWPAYANNVRVERFRSRNDGAFAAGDLVRGPSGPSWRLTQKAGKAWHGRGIDGDTTAYSCPEHLLSRADNTLELTPLGRKFDVMWRVGC